MQDEHNNGCAAAANDYTGEVSLLYNGQMLNVVKRQMANDT